MTSLGLWIWTVAQCEDGKVDEIVRKAVEYKIGHVLVKTNDGAANYNGTLGPLFRSLGEAGINCWAWTYTYGREPEDEARAFADRALRLDADGLCVDAEVEYKNHPDRARRFMEVLRSLSTRPIATSSYYLPQNHATFPWTEFYQNSAFAMPQVYWFSGSPAWMLRRSFDQHKKYVMPSQYLPVGAAYEAGAGSAQKIRVFLETVDAMGIDQASLWSWQHLTDEYWQVIYDWTHREDT